MVGYKRGKYLEFELDDKRIVKYDLSTGQSIGIRGNPVKSISHAMSNLYIDDVIKSIENVDYRNFLSFIEIRESSRIRNFGTLLTFANKYKRYEQYFQDGYKNIDSSLLEYKECPNKLYQICKKYNFIRSSIFYYRVFFWNNNIII